MYIFFGPDWILFYLIKKNYCFYFSEPSTPAWVIKSPMDFSKSSILFPISSIRVIIWSDIVWNLSWTFWRRFWTFFLEKKLLLRLCFTLHCKKENSRKLLTPAYSLDRHYYSWNSSVPYHCRFQILNQTFFLLNTNLFQMHKNTKTF